MQVLVDNLKIGSKVAPSRVLFGAHCTNFATDNLPNERHSLYYARRAKGGAGLIVMEAGCIHPSDWPYEKAIKAYDEKIVPRYRSIADAVHSYGSLVLGQLNHSGMQASGHVRKQVTFAPSAIANPATMDMPKVMENSDILACIAGFKISAEYAIKGGLDGVEINAGQNSLLRQFMSGLTNLRTDEYGGSLENRLRFALEVISTTRKAIGADAVLGLRLSCDEYAPWAGIKPEDSLEIAKMLCASGDINYLVVVTGSIYTPFATSPAMHTPPGQNLEFISQLRQAVQEVSSSTVVFNGDTVIDPQVADQVVRSGQLDGFDMTRALIADPDLIVKMRDGLADQVRPCIRCNQDCVVQSPLNQVVSCIHNPEAGYERLFPELEISKQFRNVLVIGAGPGGLETARIAALRGHKVVVYERENLAGGGVRISAQAPYRSELSGIINWRLHELKRLNVPVELGVEVTPELVAKLNPDQIIVATGSKPRPSDIPGANLPHVFSPNDVLTGKASGTKRAVIIDSEGYQAAINVADYLAGQGRMVDIFTEDNFVSLQLGALQELTPWYSRAAASGITFNPMHLVLEIGPESVRVRHRFAPVEQERIISDVDTVVFSNYALPEDSLYKSLLELGHTVYRVGDAVAPRRVTHATLEAQRIGRLI